MNIFFIIMQKENLPSDNHTKISRIIRSFVFICFLLFVCLSALPIKQAKANICASGYTGGLQALGCLPFGDPPSYCGWYPTGERGCTCPGPSVADADCNCQTTTVTVGCTFNPGYNVCLCSVGGPCTNPGGSCSNGAYTGTCSTTICNPVAPTCTKIEGKRTLWCFTSDPEPTDGPGPTSGGPSTTPTPPPTPVPTGGRQIQVTVNFYQSSSAIYNAASNSCSHTSATNYGDGVFLQSKLRSEPSWNYGLIPTHSYTFPVDNVFTGDPLTVTANAQNGEFSCACPVGCSYALQVPSGNTLTRNFYFDNYSEAWFQIFGTSIFSGDSLKSIVPNHVCSSPACQAGVFVPQPAGNNLSSGFPLLSSTSVNSIQTHRSYGSYLNNIHLTGQRSSSLNQDAFVLGFNAHALSFDYFKKLAVSTGQTIHSQTPAQTDLASWRANNWLTSSQTNFFEISGNLTIDQSKNFALNHEENAVVFVNGTLTINNTGASGDKIISVARKTSTNAGGFLAFFTTGDIIIRSNVGTTLNPATLNNPTVNFINAHLEGVFFSNQKIIVNGREQDNAIANYPDRKLIAAGTFIGVEGVELNRRADDDTSATAAYKALNNIQALENFLYRPDLLINWPDELKVSIINWREIAPRSFDN